VAGPRPAGFAYRKSQPMRIASLAALTLTAVLSVASGAQAQRVNGAIQDHTYFFNHPVAPQEMQILHQSEFKGAHKVAISVFNVAFPSEQHLVATTKGRSVLGGLSSSARAYMDTSLTGVDKATQQRIADKAYALFVQQLTEAGYEVVDQTELGRLAPEFKTWDALPNFTRGRYGAYVAPTGQAVRFLQGDAAKRDVSGVFANQTASIGRQLDHPVAFGRSPYIAHDGNLGVIAVTLIVDYGVATTTGEKRRLGGSAETGFAPGVNIAAGSFGDQGSLLAYWGPKSGGFPAYAFIQQPVHSDLPFGSAKALIEGVKTSANEVSVVADPAKFEAAADDAVGKAIPKLVSVMAANR
jgi:hypothetical protein